MQVTDPVCGMPIESTKAAATESIQGTMLYFCSTRCHERFRASPSQYLKKEPSAGERRGAHDP